MDRRSWPWRKKASAKLAKASFDSDPSLVTPAVNFKAYNEPPPALYVDQLQETPRIQIEDARVLEAISLRDQAEEKTKSLKEELSTALREMEAKEVSVKQHSKVAEEAVSGWEKAEAEALSFKQELEASVQQKNGLEDRIAHLDGALKECMKQLRHAREEQEQNIEEAVMQKTREWDKIKAQMDAKQAEIARKLMESDAQNIATTKSLQERARTIVELSEAKAKAEVEMKVLQVRVDTLQKEISTLKYELHVLNKELEIRNEEREYSRRSADAAHKQHLENVKKVAKLESECQRLRNLVRKKLPGPAAMAQMRMEVDGMGRDFAGEGNRRRSLGRNTPFLAASSVDSKQEIRAAAKDIEMLTERMLSMEEETKLLKEALSKRNGELQASRQLCARTVNKLSAAEDQLESLQGTPKSSRNGMDFQTELSVASRSEDGNGADDDVSCAESWASALITELAQFKKSKAKSKQSMESSNFDAIDDVLEADRQACVDQGRSNVEEIQKPEAINCVAEERKTLTILASKAEDQLQNANMMCREVNCKLSLVEEQLRALKLPESAGNEATTAAQFYESLNSVIDARGKLTKLDMMLDEIRISVSSVNDINDNVIPAVDCIVPSSNDQAMDGVELPTIALKPASNSTLNFVLCKLILLMEMLWPNLSGGLTIVQSEGKPKDRSSLLNIEQELQSLMNAKENVLHGKASVLEFLVHLGMLLSQFCGSEGSDLEKILSEDLAIHLDEQSSKIFPTIEALPTLVEGKANGNSNYGDEQSVKAELEKQLASVDEELGSTKSELEQTRLQVTDLQTQFTELQDVEKKLADGEATKAELQARFQETEVQVSKLQASVASLTVDLADQRKEYETAVAKCEELEQKLRGFTERQEAEQCNSRRLADEEEARSKKEREVAAAKEKLAECQRTILALGKQLTALSSPGNSTGASFDSMSMDSSLKDGRVAAAMQPLAWRPPTELPEDELPQSGDGGGGDYTTTTEHNHFRRRKPPNWNGNYRRYVVDQAETVPDHWSPAFRHASGPQFLSDNPQNGSMHHFHDYPSACSPPHTAMSSPARSPARYIAHSSTSSRRIPGNSVRTSLTKSMNRVAAASSTPDSVKHSKPSNGFTRFFSRSKNHG